MQLIDLVPDLRPIIMAARQVRDENNRLSRWLPYREVQSVSYRLGRRKVVNQTVPIRALDAPAVPIRRPGVVDVQGDLPAITPIVDLSEMDLTQEMIIAQQLAGVGVDWEPLVTSAAGVAAATIDNTLEAFRGQALSALKVSLTSADGNVHEVDFGADPEQVITVTNAWNTADGDPFADLDAAQEAFTDRAGSPAAVMLTTARVQAAILQKVQALFPNAPVGYAEVNTYMANRGLPAIETYDRAFRDYDGSRQRVYPQGHATLLPAGDPVGSTEMGITQESVQQVQNRVLNAGEAPGLTVVTLGRDNPVQRAVKGAAIGMPVIGDIDQITVLRGLVV